MKMPWLRLHSEARSDPKLEMLTDAQHRVWFRLLCYANDQPTRGTVLYRSTKLLAVQVARGDESLLIETLDVLAELDIITHSDDQVGFVHWNERQYDKPSDAPEAVRERVRQHRASVTERSGESEKTVKRDVTPSNAVKRIRGEGEEREKKEETENTWMIDHPPAPTRLEAIPPPPSPSEDTSALAQEVQSAANVYSATIVSYVQRIAPAAADLGLDLVEQAALYRDKSTRKGVSLSAAGLKKWIDNELSPDRARASPQSQSPPKKFKVFDEVA